MNYMKLQSALEYLMTYGWAILIIAVVLGALFGLGFFNSYTFQPKATAGNCQVYRPAGPHSTLDINLEGICNNEIPEYVAQLNGQSSDIAGNSVFASPMFASAWVYPTSYGTSGYEVISEFDGPNPQGGYFQLALYTNGEVLGWNGYFQVSFPLTVPLNRWSFIAFNITQNGETVYLNGKSATVSTSEVLPTSSNTFWIIGTQICCGSTRYFQGDMANIQVYNTSLSANDVSALYQEGIGGSPIAVPWLVAWWPLNGNANDYSGNGNTGTISNVIFTTSWENGYSAP